MPIITEAEHCTLEDQFSSLKMLYVDPLRGKWPWREVFATGMRRRSRGVGVDIFIVEYGYNMHHGRLQDVDCTYTRDDLSCHRDDDDFGGRGTFALGILKRMAPSASLHFVKIEALSTAMDVVDRILWKFEHAKESGERPKFVVNISVDYTNASLV